MQNSTLCDPNYNLGHCSKFGGKASKGHLFYVGKWSLLKEQNHAVNMKAISNMF